MLGYILRRLFGSVAWLALGASVLGWTGSAAAQVFPIAGTGYSQNMVVGVGQQFTTPFSAGGITATMDAGTLLTGTTWYALGQYTSNTVAGIPVYAATGLPMGTMIGAADATTGGDTFQLQNTGTNNAILLAAPGGGSGGPASATFTLNTPANYSDVSFLMADGHGTASIGVTLNYADNSTVSRTLTIQDWFPANAVTTAYVANGRIANTSYNMQNTGNPRLGCYDLTGLPTTSPLASMTFSVLSTNNSQTTTAIFGVSGNSGLYWTGNSDSAWSVAGSDTNWNGGSAYTNGSNVVFDYTGLNTNINVAGTVQPGNITFDNRTVPYSFSGASIAGSGAVLLSTSAGSVTFNNANTFTGPTTIGGGTLTVANPLALQNSLVAVNATNGLAFALGTTATAVGGLSGSSSFALQDAGGNPVALTFGGNNSSASYSGVISGGGTLAKAGTGIIILASNNTYSGGTSFNGGAVYAYTLSAGTATSSSIGAGLPQGASISFNGGTLVNASAQGTMVTNGTNNAASWNPNITLNSGGGTLVMANGNLPFTGTLSGSGNLTITGTGAPGPQVFLSTTTINANPNFTGNIILAQGGNIQYRTDAPNAFGTTSGVTINYGGIFSNDNGTNLGGSSGTGGYYVHGQNTLANAFTLNGGSLATQGVNVNYAGPVTINSGTTSYIGDYVNSVGSLTIGGSLLGPGTISTIGTQVVTLSGATGGFTGMWIAQSAATAFVGSASGGTGATWLTNGSNFLINNSGIVNFGALGGSAGSITNGVAATSSTLAVGALGTNTTFGGTIGNGAGTLTLKKVGPGALTLTGTSPSLGPVVVNGGTLQLGQVVTSFHYTTTASVAGFGADTAGATGQNATWTFNTAAINTTSITGGSLTLTDGAVGEIRTAYYNTKVPVDGPFTASFVYNPSGTSGGMADGMTFVLQNAGLTSSGTSGSGLGYASVGSSGAVGLILYPGTPTGSARGTNFFSGGALNAATVSTSSAPYASGGGVVLGGESGDPIQVVLAYNGSSTLTESMTDTVTLGTFAYTFTNANFASLTGGSSAYVGFTGATGGIGAAQVIGNFNFSGTGGRYTAVSLTGGTNTLPAATALTVAAGATVDLFGGSQQVASLSGSGMLTSSNSSSLARLTISGATASTFSGAIGDGAGQFALAVSGGSLTLSGTDSYTGGTTVNGGALIVTSAGGIQSGTNLTVGSGIAAFGAPLAAGAVPGDAMPVPEPCTFALLAAAFAACMLIRRRAFQL